MGKTVATLCSETLDTYYLRQAGTEPVEDSGLILKVLTCPFLKTIIYVYLHIQPLVE